MEIRQSIDERIIEWRERQNRQVPLSSVDAQELESRLRSQIEALVEAGLAEDEAFLVAVKRVGGLSSLLLELAQENSEQRPKKPAVSTGEALSPRSGRLDAMVAFGLAIAAALAIKIPELFGYHLKGSELAESFYMHNFSLFVLPFLAGYFVWKRELDGVNRLRLGVAFIAGGLIINAIPFVTEGSTEVLATIHLPMALWFAVGFAYMGGQWRSHNRRMNFVRFTGEWFIFLVLIALGGGVFIGSTFLVFNAISLNPEPLIEAWVVPCGVMGAVIVSAWLVEAKQSITQNIAPILTRLFTPLFVVLLLAFLATMIWTGNGFHMERDALIGFDLLLALVLALVLFSISARDVKAPPTVFDALQLLLVICALLVDGLALLAIASRISEFGFSANKVAALGENLILLVNLGWAAMLYARFLMKRIPFTSLERWQTAYIPVYPIWAGIVVALFPIIFNYR